MLNLALQHHPNRLKTKNKTCRDCDSFKRKDNTSHSDDVNFGFVLPEHCELVES